MKLPTIGSALFAVLLFAPAIRADALQDLLTRLNQGGSAFKTMTANVHYTTHTDVIDDNTEEGGTVIMKKIGPTEVQGRIDFTDPPANRRTVIFEKREAQIYTPKMKTVQIYDLGSKGEQLDRFLMIGFGTAGDELAHDYDMKVLGSDTVQGIKTTRVELVPKSADIRGVVSKLELWIPDSPGKPYPIQEKIYEKNPKDYRIVSYTDLKINQPIPADALKLKTPSGVKTERVTK